MTNIVDIYSPTANMYGCEPCPKCGSKYRCVFNEKPGIIQCDHCGYDEKAEYKDLYAEEEPFFRRLDRMND
jgi:ribosomal protein L37AE/L43A